MGLKRRIINSNMPSGGRGERRICTINDPAYWDALDALPPAVKSRLQSAVGSYSPLNIQDLVGQHGEEAVLLALDKHDKELCKDAYGDDFEYRGVVRA